MTDEAARAWDEWEAKHSRTPQQKENRVRVRGYMIVCARRVKAAQEELERRVTLLERARRDAERALEELRGELAHAEEYASLVMLDDEDVNDALAMEIEKIEDV